MSIGLFKGEPIFLVQQEDSLFARGEHGIVDISSTDLNSFVPLSSEDSRYDSILALIRQYFPLAWVKIVSLRRAINNKHSNKGLNYLATGNRETVES
jgi:hypothetical protein